MIYWPKAILVPRYYNQGIQGQNVTTVTLLVSFAFVMTVNFFGGLTLIVYDAINPQKKTDQASFSMIKIK